MSYRAFRVFFRHGARDLAGIAGLSSNNAVDSLHPLDALIDDRHNSTYLQFSTSESDHYIDVDLGANPDQVSTMIIPVGHNLNGIALDLLADNSFPPTTSQAAATPSTDLRVLFSFGGITRRYWRLEMNTAGKHKLPQLILTRKFDFPLHGIRMRGAEDSFRHNFQRFVQPSGISTTLLRGPRQRVMEFIFQNSLSGQELTDMREWITVSAMHRVFMLDPPSFSATPDTTDPSVAYKFDEPEPDARWGSRVPASELDRHNYKLRVIESVD